MSSQIVKMFEESNQRMKAIMEGNYNPEKVAAEQKEFNGQVKLLNAVISAYAVASKNARALKDLQKMNLLSNTTAIDIDAAHEDEKIVCREQGGALITRESCLNFSGDALNINNCQNCEYFATTRQMLLPRCQSAEVKP